MMWKKICVQEFFPEFLKLKSRSFLAICDLRAHFCLCVGLSQWYKQDQILKTYRLPRDWSRFC